MELLYIKQILAGDISKFSYFVERYKNMAFSIAFRIINNKEDAEEAVQDSFLKAYKALPKFRQEAKFSTWFYKIVVNTSLTKVKSKVESTYGIDADEISYTLIENIESIYHYLVHEERKKFINLALETLDREARLLLTLYYLNENSIAEIAEITDISQENIKMKLHRARKKMFMVLSKLLKLEKI